MDDYELIVDVITEVRWRGAPKDVQEAILRQQADVVVRAIAEQIKPEVRQMLLDRIESTFLAGMKR